MTSCPGSTESQMAIRRRLRQDARPVRPHLDAIDPAAVGAYAADRWILAAGPLAASQAKIRIAEDIATIARFAQTGEYGSGAIDAIEALDILHDVVVWLFSRTIDAPPDPMTVLLDAPEGASADRLALAVVLLAARGRIRLAREDVIAVPEIAALTGLDQSHLARLARQGKLERMPAGSASKQYPGPVKGQSARELLREHGVLGI